MERNRDRDTETETESQTGTHTETVAETQPATERDRQTYKQRQTQADKQTEAGRRTHRTKTKTEPRTGRDREPDRQGHRHIDAETETEINKQVHKHVETDRQTEAETHTYIHRQRQRDRYRQEHRQAQTCRDSDRDREKHVSFSPVTVGDILGLTKRAPNKQSAADPLPTWLLKECAATIAPFITQLVNRSISTGRVPTIFKIATITPLLKKPGLDTADVRSHRPISNLSVLSKMLERVVSKQLVNYLNINQLFPDKQSAYRAFHSTETVLADNSL